METLPTIKQIESLDTLTANEKGKLLKVVLNSPPPAKWLKKQNGVVHLPVDKVKFMLSKAFGHWWTEIKNVQVIANSVTVVLTLHYYNPITGHMERMDGVGAAPINTQKGAGALDFNSIVHDSVHKCAPAAASFALKNAAKNLGRVFGSELMVDDKIDYQKLLDEETLKNATLIEK